MVLRFTHSYCKDHGPPAQAPTYLLSTPSRLPRESIQASLPLAKKANGKMKNDQVTKEQLAGHPVVTVTERKGSLGLESPSVFRFPSPLDSSTYRRAELNTQKSTKIDGMLLGPKLIGETTVSLCDPMVVYSHHVNLYVSKKTKNVVFVA